MRMCLRLVLLFFGLSGWAAAIDLGHPRCRCTNQSDLNNVWAMTGTPVGFGFGCAQHELDLINQVGTGAAVLGLVGATPCVNPSTNQAWWCYARWCYVDPGTCSVAAGMPDRARFQAYSYATCGSLDTYSKDLAPNSYVNKPLLAVYLTNSWGFEGSYYDDSTGEFSGTTALYFQELLAATKANIQVVAKVSKPNATHPADISWLPAEVRKQFLAETKVPNSLGSFPFEACTFASGMGFVDICIGSTAMSAARTNLSNFITFYHDNIYLVVPSASSSSGSSLILALARAGSPFTRDMWIWICSIILISSATMGVFERSWAAYYKCLTACKGQPSISLNNVITDNFKLSLLFKHIVHDVWFYFVGMVTSNTEITKLKSPGGRSVGTGFAIFTVFVVSNYTANLASNLVISNQATGTISSMDDVGNRTICVEIGLDELLRRQYPKNQFVAVKRVEVLKAVQDGQCVVAAQRGQDFIVDSAVGTGCSFEKKELVFSYPQGVPVSMAAYRTLSWHHSNATDFAIMQRIPRIAPLSTCKVASASITGSGLGPDDMAMPIFVFLLFLGLAFLMIPAHMLEAKFFPSRLDCWVSPHARMSVLHKENEVEDQQALEQNRSDSKLLATNLRFIEELKQTMAGVSQELAGIKSILTATDSL